MMSHPLRALALAAAILLSGRVPAAQGTRPWESLPPTPPLPAHTVAHHIEIGGARIWYATWGRKSERVPVLLLHGGFGNSAYFAHLIPALVSHGYYVIAMDSRGHGRSTRSDAPMSYHLMADDVIGLLDSLQIRRVELVGWSDGGCTGFDLALNHPDRLAGLFAFGANADVSGDREGFDKTPVFAAYLKRAPDEYRKLSPTPDQWPQFSAAVGRMWDTLPAFTAAQLRSISVPTVIADGQYDEAIKQSHDRYMAQTIPGAHLVILPAVSHFAMLQNPAEFNHAVLEFLEHPRGAESAAR